MKRKNYTKYSWCKGSLMLNLILTVKILDTFFKVCRYVFISFFFFKKQIQQSVVSVSGYVLLAETNYTTVSVLRNIST